MNIIRKPLTPEPLQLKPVYIGKFGVVLFLKSNVVGDLLDIETCSSNVEVFLQPVPLLLASTCLTNHTFKAEIVILRSVMNIIRK